MAATTDTIRPDDVRELLALSERVPHRDPDTRPYKAAKRLQAAKRELVHALEATPVLIVGGAQAPLLRGSTDGPRLIAFTDAEAGNAWASDQHRAAPPIPDAQATPRPSSVADGRAAWISLLARTGATALVVNPAGPVGFVVDHAEFGWRPRARESQLATGGSEWFDLGARARERARVAEVMSTLADVIASGQESRMRAISDEVKGTERFGSLHDWLTFRVLIARWRVQFGQMRDGSYELIWSSLWWARIGDAFRAIDGLLEAGALLARLRADGYVDPEHPDFVDVYQRRLADALPSFELSYREAERAELIGSLPAAERRRPFGTLGGLLRQPR